MPGIKADFQSSHEAPRSSLQVHAWVLSSNHNAKQLILIRCKHSQRAADFQSSHEAPRSCCEWLHLIKINSSALWLDESDHACTRSELRGASCEDWKSALRPLHLESHDLDLIKIVGHSLSMIVWKPANVKENRRSLFDVELTVHKYFVLFFTLLGFLCSYRGIYSIFPSNQFPFNNPH
jgi:hypothetical protein